MRWPVQFEDVTAAFLQGHKLPPEREVYVRLPKGYPDYILEFKKLGKGFRSDVPQLTKGGFGLPESPRLWYMCYKDTLEKTGMKELKLSPGVFVAHHRDGRLRAVACIHVDDTRYCGDETSQEIWDQVHAALNFGDYRKATDGWVKFCGRWEKQNAETFEFEYCMDNYAVNLEKMKNEEAEGDLTSQEKKQMARKIQIDLAVLKQALVEGHSNFVRWVPGRHMLADAMTKWSPNGALNDAMTKGTWSLQDTPEAMKLRSTAAQKRKMYRRQNKPGTNGGMCENTSPGLSAVK